MKLKTRVWLGAMICFLFMPLCSAFAQTQEEKVADKKFWTINGFTIGSTIYDIESTYFTLGKCRECHEANPLMRPFVEAGRPWLYAVQSSTVAGAIYASYEMKKRNHKLWYILPVALTVAHTLAGTHNIRLAMRF